MAQSARAIYWSAIIADFHRSGLTHVEFYRRRQISVHAFVNAGRNHARVKGTRSKPHDIESRFQ